MKAVKRDINKATQSDREQEQRTPNADSIYGILSDYEKKDINKSQIRGERIKEKYGD